MNHSAGVYKYGSFDARFSINDIYFSNIDTYRFTISIRMVHVHNMSRIQITFNVQMKTEDAI